MSYKRFKIGQSVIINNNGVYNVAVIIEKKIKSGKRTYTVRTESGFEIPYVGIDDKENKIYLDSAKTDKISNKIQTNLSLDTDNLRKNI